MATDAGRRSRIGTAKESERPAQRGTVPGPPNRLVRIVEALTPPGSASGNSVINTLWEKHGALAGVLPHIPAARAWPGLSRARDAFYWNIAIAQATILLLPFVDILSLPLVLNLGLVLAVFSSRAPEIGDVN